jgi:hypothetical protein
VEESKPARMIPGQAGFSQWITTSFFRFIIALINRSIFSTTMDRIGL